ncbi:MAG TPA: hypothetical protein ENI13_00525 [candidate division CPR3 bacterium]|uniref:Uncharacterized protein n=1 Tax=candidate division CPR3 bacterium TaxID=2268181 RepID=A0A7C1NLM5_UNCC3|nr:hypothetical protein [candidate division CPR3 bacterium]
MAKQKRIISKQAIRELKQGNIERAAMKEFKEGKNPYGVGISHRKSFLETQYPLGRIADKAFSAAKRIKRWK